MADTSTGVALRSAILIVNATWTHGRHLYRRSGFREIGRIEAFFEPKDAPPQAAVMMRKPMG
jgi:hypothetical protein